MYERKPRRKATRRQHQAEIDLFDPSEDAEILIAGFFNLTNLEVQLLEGDERVLRGLSLEVGHEHCFGSSVTGEKSQDEPETEEKSDEQGSDEDPIRGL